jgi:hypothetical protein
MLRLGRTQLRVRDEPLVDLGKRFITRHNYYLRRAADTSWHVGTSAERVDSPMVSHGQPSAHTATRTSRLSPRGGRMLIPHRMCRAAGE